MLPKGRKNAKIQNMEQRFTTELALHADLAAMGLTELNTRLKQLTCLSPLIIIVMVMSFLLWQASLWAER